MFEKKQEVVNRFAACTSEEQKYELVIEMGRKAKKLDSLFKTEANLVRGCQSTMYLRTWNEESICIFKRSQMPLSLRG